MTQLKHAMNDKDAITAALEDSHKAMTQPDTEFNNLCADCGMTANDMTCIRKYGSRARKPAFTVSTMNQGVCGICGKTKYVTEQRDYFYPSERAMTLLKKYLRKGIL